MRSLFAASTPPSPGSSEQSAAGSEIPATQDFAGRLDRQSKVLVTLKATLQEVLAQQIQQNERLQQLGARQERALSSLGQQLQARTQMLPAEPLLPQEPSLAILATLQSVEARLEQMQQAMEKSPLPCEGLAMDFVGVWYEGQEKHIITGRFLHTKLDEAAGFARLALEVHSPRDFSVSGAGDVAEHAQLSEDGQQLLWHDGRVWSREAEPDIVGSSELAETPWREVSKGTPGGSLAQAASRNFGSGFRQLATAWTESDERKAKPGPEKPSFVKAATFAEWLEDGRVTHSRWVDRVVHSCAFEAVAAVVILINAVYIGYTANWFIEHPLEDPGTTFVVADTLFCVFFSAELLLRLASLGKSFLGGPDAFWYVFDMLLIIISVIELSVKNSGGYTWLRSLRVFKLGRVIRLVRTSGFLKELRLMMDCMIGSLVSLFWCLVTIAFLIYLFSLFFVQGLAGVVEDLEQERVDSEASAADRLLGAVIGRQLESCEDELKGERLREVILARYGSISKAMLRLWTASTGGVDWQDEYDVIKLSGTWHALVFIGFIAFMIVVVWNIVTSTILEKALRFAKPDIDDILMDKRHRDKEDMCLLESMFNKAGIDLAQTVRKEQLMGLLDQRDLADLLKVRGIDIREASSLLTEDSDGAEGIDAKTLIISCLRIKGFATSIDLHTTHNQIMRVLRRHGRCFARSK